MGLKFFEKTRLQIIKMFTFCNYLFFQYDSMCKLGTFIVKWLTVKLIMRIRQSTGLQTGWWIQTHACKDKFTYTPFLEVQQMIHGIHIHWWKGTKVIPLMRKGWLQHFLSSIIVFIKFGRLLVELAPFWRNEKFLSRIAL